MIDAEYEIPVAVDGSPVGTWVLRAGSLPPRSIALTLVADDGREWSASGGDAFDALMNLRLKVEPSGVQVGCNGARRNAWSSGMLRSMGEGIATYLLELGQHKEKPPTVKTLEPASLDAVVTVAEQLAFHREWLAELGY